MQTTYNVNMDVAQEGAIADSSPVREIVTRLADTGGIDSGLLVCFDHDRATQDVQVGSLPGAAVDITVNAVGLAVHDTSLEAQTPLYPAECAVAVLRKGRAWVMAEDTITLGATNTVNVRYVAGSGRLGGFLGTAVGGETAVLPSAKWLTSTTAPGQLALVEFNLV